ncbi:MAG: prenyltransferase [Candidatus Omnitrophota bacterium]|nr:prenyltransferase [Candidatus Omnitrophota bacterium]
MEKSNGKEDNLILGRELLMRFFKEVKAWILLSRLPFHLVGILPFITGSILYLKITKTFNFPVFLLGAIGVVLIMLSTYYNGEIHDIEEDRLSVKLEKNFFSAGSQVLVDGLISSKRVKLVSYVAIGSAFFIGLLLQFYYKTGPWTIPLGITGIITGFYYSKPPFRWVKRGVGELLIGYSYGWLPVAVGFYLQAGFIHPLAHWISLPIACSIFNVILINEFPDYPADMQVNKNNLVVKYGKVKATAIYIAATIIGITSFIISLTKGLPLITGLFYTPIGILSFVAIWMVLEGRFNDHCLLERTCLITLLINLGTCLVYIIGLLV